MIKNYSKYILLLEEFERKTFKVGDIVKVKEGSIVSGKIGKVIGEGNLTYSVEFDDWFQGHNCGGLARPGHGWELMWYELELVENEKDEIKWYRNGKLIKEK